jgi:CAAX protease family protein
MDLLALFVNTAGRLRSGWRVVLFTLIYFGVFFLLGSIARVIVAAAWNLNVGDRLGQHLQDLSFRLILAGAALGAGWITGRLLEGLPWRALGLTLHQGWLRDLWLGVLVGLGSLALAVLVATVGGALHFSLQRANRIPAVGNTLASSALLFFVAALAEEALFRGYPLQTMARANLAWLAVLLTSVPFAVIHLNNPNVVAGFTFINTALAGVWLAVAYLRTRSLWLPLGIHCAWNWALGALFGLPVSGITRITPDPLLLANDTGPAWLSGGTYGIEGGLACMIALVVSTLFLWRTKLVSATPELFKLTSRENPSPRLIQSVLAPDGQETEPAAGVTEQPAQETR